MPNSDDRGKRWMARSRTGFLVSALAIAIPIAFSVAVAYGLSMLLPHPTSRDWQILWWVTVLGSSWLAAVIGERVVRPLLPLASLLKMSLLFPDRAPSRFSVAWRAGSTRQLDRYVRGQDDNPHREPMTAAVQILTLVTALSTHDRRTRGHSERVRAYTDLLADEMKLLPGDRDRLRWASLLHDVGKMAVHPEILNKKGSPSQEEWEILRQHPMEGARLIEPIREWLGPWGLAVEQHHENFDGTGYPLGLAGEQISLAARIVSVADAFEVMTSSRSYKSSESPAAARKELTRCAGTQFDPAIVRAFLNISVGQQRLIIGPLSWIFDIPIASQIGNLGNVVVATSQVALLVGSVALGAAAASTGNSGLHDHSHAGSISAHGLKRRAEIVEEASSSTIGITGAVYDAASLTDTGSNAGGTVTYAVYDNPTCSVAHGGLITTLGPVRVTNGHVPRSPLWTAMARAGIYFFVATYSGDPHDTSATSGCAAVSIRVKRSSPAIALQLSSTSTVVGGSISVKAILLGAAGGATGVVTYSIYRDSTCSTTQGGSVVTLGSITLSGGLVSASPNWTAPAPGIYYFVAAYSGDAKDQGATSGCANDLVTVTSASAGGTPPPTHPPGAPSPPSTPTTTTTTSTTTTTTTTTTIPSTPPAPPAPPAPLTPSITTQLSASSINVGATLHDSATLTGATASASGTVTYDVYNNDTCSSAGGGLVATLGTVAVTYGAVADSPDWTGPSPGTFYFVAAYSGDVNNQSATSGCASEALSVVAVTPSITTQLSASSINVGQSVDVNAVLTGLTTGAGGNVSYVVYTQNDCQSPVFFLLGLPPVAVTNGVTAGSIPVTLFVPGTYYVVASYSGDLNNGGLESDCAGGVLTVS